MESTVRVVGSGFTVIRWGGRPLALLTDFRDTGQGAVGRPYETITTIGDRRIREVVYQRVLGEGGLSFTLTERWNEEVWWQIPGLDGTMTIVEVFDALNADPTPMTITSIVKPPNGGPTRGRLYHNIHITGIPDGDSVTFSQLSVTKGVEALYTHKTRI